MIAVHLIIFAGVIFLFAGQHFQLLKIEAFQDRKTRKLFYLVILLGNGIGLLLSLQTGSGKSYTGEVRIEKKEHISEQYEMKAVIEEDHTEETIQFLVPGKTVESAAEENEDSSPDIKQTIEDEIRIYNQNIADDTYYYLPDTVDGMQIQWKENDDPSGSMLAVLFLLAACSLVFFRQREEVQKKRKREEEMLYDYPEIIMKFTLLIQAGMTVRSAFLKIASDYAKQKKSRREAYEEMLLSVNELEGGVSETEVYTRFGERCGCLKYKTFSSLLIQNLRRGNSGLTEILERESTEAWEERKRNARVSGEKAVTRLLLPMIMMLIVIIVMIMVPSFLSFYGT